MGKKRRADALEDDETASKKSAVDVPALFDEIHQEIVDAPTIEMGMLKRLNEFLDTHKDGDKSFATKVDQKFLCALLVVYTAKITPKDLLIYDILLSLETTYAVKLSALQPLVWGERSRHHYDKLRDLGSSLHRINPNVVLTYLDGPTMWQTVRNHTKVSSSSYQQDVYDIRFLLRLFSSMIHPGSELDCKKFVVQNGLSLLFSCCSAKNQSTRMLAYYSLQRFLAFLKELKEDDLDDSFKERKLFIYVIRLFKQSIESVSPRLSNMVTHFFARVCKLILNPSGALYNTILTFLCLKPQVDLNNVPELFKLLFSSSTKNHHEERQWVLTLISEAMIEPMDYNVLQNRSGMKLLQSLFASCLIMQDDRKLILATLKAAVRMPTVAHDLFTRCNLHSWIASVIQYRKLTRWECNYLAQILCILLRNERYFYIKNGGDPSLSYVGAKMTSRVVCSVMRSQEEKEEASVKHREALEELLMKPWSVKGEMVEKEEEDDLENGLPDLPDLPDDVPAQPVEE